ncbi:hypothetical protein [Mesorhizobium sp. M0571]|uniref:hypothetical protein n=1 Tax=Mesorhizobium sp. M0571 TaxID=2956960 RepID=UPI003339E047
MKRSKKLLLVYAEIRRAVGSLVSAGEVLEIAERLIDLANYRDVIDRCGTMDFSTSGSIALDHAFDDGGWALLHDCYASGLLGDDDPVDYSWRPGRRAAPLMERYA